MKSKNNLANLQAVKIAAQKLETFIIRRCLKDLRGNLSDFKGKLYKYTSQQNHRETEWLLHVDRFTPDDKKALLREDDEIKARSTHFRNFRKNDARPRFTQRYSTSCLSSSSEQKKKLIRNSSQIRAEHPSRALTPLDSTSQKSLEALEDDSDAINQFRQHKTRREEYKNKILQAERKEIFKLIDKTLANLALNPGGKKPKMEKIQQIDHFVNMEVTFRETEDAQQEKLKKVPQSIYKNKNSKTERVGKGNGLSFHLSRGKYEELKPEEKVYLLNIPNDLKLNNGVTLRESQKHGHNFECSPGNPNRKKLQFLKNDQINPVKIKLSELMSYKKITTMTNLAYCSSMKTIKDIPKDGTDTKISIDSKQFLDEPSGSKRLIKIANRRIYEQLLIDFSDEGVQMNLKKTRLKSKKQGKVRFDNVAA